MACLCVKCDRYPPSLMACLCGQVWQVSSLPNGGVSVEALSDLVRHNRAVNAVRFSPDGTLLASADDGEACQHAL